MTNLLTHILNRLAMPIETESSTWPIWVFQEGEYEDDVAGNSAFENSRDLVLAFQLGNYVSAAVPESLFSQPHRERRRGDKIVRGDYGPLDSLFAELA
jgi:hypothetical protein